MTDPRLKKLAENLIHYSCDLKKGENLLIEIFDCDAVLAEELVKAAYAAGGRPFVSVYSSKAEREWLMQAEEEQISARAKWDAARMEDMDAYISFRGNNNIAENADIPDEKTRLYNSIYVNKVHYAIRLKKKWCVLRYPNAAMAQLSGMSTRAFEDFYFNVCNLDYAKMDKAMDPLKALMDKTNRVRLVSPGTDIAFSIQGIGAVKCAGKMNVPDGEVFTAPVRDSVQGKITFNTPSLFEGFKFEGISLTFKSGKIVDAVSNDTRRMNSIFNTDEGARYVGEFAIGVNPYINAPMCDILFDEKIAGSIHFTPGSAYDEADNQNKSAIHWDLVLIQTSAWGGGEIYFDDVLIRKDGLFVPDTLQCLNPGNLK